MAKKENKKETLDKKIDELLTQQKELNKKFSLLEEKKGTVRESVFKKVKDDYTGRLKDIEFQLKEQSSYLVEKYNKFKDDSKDIQVKKNEAEAKIEETELRHSVGEYPDEEYKKLTEELKSELQGIDEQYNTLTQEMEKIKEILDTIGVGAEEAEEKEEEKTEVVEEETPVKEEEENINIEKEEKETELPDVSEAEKLAEEIFSGDETTAEVTEGVETKKAEEGDWLEGLEKELSIGEEENKAPEKEAKDKEKAEAVEGIKCPKCGFMNKPDAWYCEKCGAELSPEE